MQALRRRRNEVSVELRKAKKDEALSKRRNLGPAYDSDSDTPLSPLQEQDANRANTAAAALSLEDIARVITTSDNPEECYNVRQGHCDLFVLLLCSIFFFFFLRPLWLLASSSPARRTRPSTCWWRPTWCQGKTKCLGLEI